MKKDEEENYWEDQLRSFQEFRRRNPIKKIGESVRQRTKKDPITVEGPLSPPLPREKGLFHSFPEIKDVNLKVTATPEAWQKMAKFILENPGHFAICFLSHFANPAALKAGEKNRPRGKQKAFSPPPFNKQKIISGKPEPVEYSLLTVSDLKIRSGVLYAFLSYWCEKPIKEWPDYFQKIIEMAKREEAIEYCYLPKYPKKFDAKALTAYIMEKAYREKTQQMRLESFFEFDKRESIENFYITYIQDDKRPDRIRKKFIENNSPEKIASLAHSLPALNHPFTILGVL